MNSLDKNIVDSPSSDPIDRLIFERGLRIRKVWFDKNTDVIVVLLNNKQLLKRSLSDFDRLFQATDDELNNFESDGIGIHWPSLDEDLSLRGFLKYELLQLGSPVIT